MRTAGIAVIRSGVPVIAIIPKRLEQRAKERIGGSTEEAVSLALSSISSFSDVVLRAIGGEIRLIETDISRIYVIPVDAETKVLLFSPVEANKKLLEAIRETVRNVRDPKELEVALKRLLESLNQPEAEFRFREDDVEAVAEAIKEEMPDSRVFRLYKIAISILAPAGIPNASIFKRSKIPCIEQPPSTEPSKANELLEKILNAEVSEIPARVLKELPGSLRKFSGGNIVRLDAPEYEHILSCVEHLKERKRILESFQEISSHVVEYLRTRPEEIEKEIVRKQRFLESIRGRLEEEKKEVEARIFDVIFSEEYGRALDLYDRLSELVKRIQEALSKFPEEPPKGLSEFYSRLSNMYAWSDELDSMLSAFKAELSRARDEVMRIEESMKAKESAHDETLEAEMREILERIRETERLLEELEEELSKISQIKKLRNSKIKQASKKASKLLEKISKALSELSTIDYTSVAIPVFAIEHEKGFSIYVPKAFKTYEKELKAIALEALYSGLKPLDREVVREALIRLMSRSKRLEKKIRSRFEAFL